MNDEAYRYPLASSTWDARELEALQRVVASGRYTMGPEVAAYEQAFAGVIGTKHAVAVNSGSSANLVLLAALRHHSTWGFEAGAEIIVPAVSWGTTYYPACQHGLTLRFVDVSAADWNLDLRAVESAVNDRTAGVLAVNLLGAPAPLPQLRELCEQAGIFLIEDNCESLGASIDGHPTGSIGLAGTHSTFFSHHICTIEGGVVTTDDDELHELMVSMRAHGWLRGLPADNRVHPLSGDPFLDSFTFALPGYNLRPTEITGATGKEQLLKLPGLIEQRRLNADAFLACIEQFPWLRAQRPRGESSWFGFGMVISPDAPVGRRALTDDLAAAGVESRPIVAGNFTRHPVIAQLPHAPLPDLPVADELHDRGLFVGNGHVELSGQLELLRAVLEAQVSGR